MEREDKLKKYYEAKTAYYEGTPIMEDAEFDELELELGLENKSIIGAGSTPNYTIKHPFIMGSLSKIQIKESDNNEVNWFHFSDQVMEYLNHSKAEGILVPCIVTPKFDGCSFEYYYNKGEITVSSRGDGNYGKDLSQHLSNKIKDLGKNIHSDEYTLRGEVLIDKNIFETKYASFTNPRSFVSGILNRKYEDIEDMSVLDDLSIIVYDFRKVNENGEWEDCDWLALSDVIDDSFLPEKYTICEFDGPQSLKEIYTDFDSYRSSYKFALDGIVIKPIFEYRNLNLTKERPDDCVAIKFIPIMKETNVIGIDWQLGKTGEYTPVVRFEEIELDGKKVNKASGHNYGYLFDSGINVGARIKISLAGDIIPFIYDVVYPMRGNKLYDSNMNCYVDGCHLMKQLTLVEKMEVDFLASCKSLNISGIGDKQAKQIFDYLEYKVDHIFFVDDDKIIKSLERGEGKIALNAVNAVAECKKNKNLADVIASMNIKDCGSKTAEQCARYLINQNLADFSGLSNAGWQWVVDACLPFDIDNEAHKTLNRLISILHHKDNSSDGYEFNKYMNDYQTSNDNLIKVILTGSPSKYKNKKEFLLKHSEYIETTKWKDCKILFTGDINSTSSKMVKAKKLGIDIQEY